MTTKFDTRLKVPVLETIDALPTGAHLEKVYWDAEARAVVMEWSHDHIRAPMQYGNDFPLENLLKRELPAGYRDESGEFSPPQTAGSEPGDPANGAQGEPATGVITMGPLKHADATPKRGKKKTDAGN